MRKLAVFFLTICLVFTAIVSVAQTPPPPDYFPLKVGASWTYQSTSSAGAGAQFTVKVVSEELLDNTTLYKVETSSESGLPPIQDWYSKPSEWVLTHRQAYPSNNQMVQYDPPRKSLKNPLNSGDTWEWSGKGMFGVEIQETNRVMDAESVTVPGGTFDAMKVETNMVQGGTPVKKTYWYANHVGFIKGIVDTGSFQSTSELVKYNLQP